MLTLTKLNDIIILEREEEKKMKKLMGWNGCYGCMLFEIYIAYEATLEEKKAYYESLGYKCYIMTEEEIQKYYDSFK